MTTTGAIKSTQKLLPVHIKLSRGQKQAKIPIHTHLAEQLLSLANRRGKSKRNTLPPHLPISPAHLILKCKRVNYVIFPRRPCLFANSITNMAGLHFPRRSPVCFKQSSRFTIKMRGATKNTER